MKLFYISFRRKSPPNLLPCVNEKNNNLCQTSTNYVKKKNFACKLFFTNFQLIFHDLTYLFARRL